MTFSTAHLRMLGDDAVRYAGGRAQAAAMLVCAASEILMDDLGPEGAIKVLGSMLDGARDGFAGIGPDVGKPQ